MIKIAITTDTPGRDHPAMIETLLDNGWDYVHVRYPQATFMETATILNAVAPEMRQRITIHDHFGLAAAGLAGGIHLNRRNSGVPSGFRGRISASAHSVDEARRLALDPAVTYVTLSPCFESVSKPGYGRNSHILKEFSELDADLWRLKVVGLGGITPENLSAIASAGFGGFAVSGFLFGCADPERFREVAGQFSDF